MAARAAEAKVLLAANGVADGWNVTFGPVDGAARAAP
jgi:hypothetical protein